MFSFFFVFGIRKKEIRWQNQIFPSQALASKTVKVFSGTEFTRVSQMETEVFVLFGCFSVNRHTRVVMTHQQQSIMGFHLHFYLEKMH